MMENRRSGQTDAIINVATNALDVYFSRIW